MAGKLVLKVIKVIQETADTKTLRLSAGKPLDFRPGQFLMLSKKAGSDILSRAYSISSSPTVKDYVDVTFKLYPEGKFSPLLYKLKEGDKIDGIGPMGEFVIDEKDKDVVFIAGGTGITPFMCAMRYATEKRLGNKMMLIYSTRTPEEIPFRKELFALPEKNKNIRIVVTVTRPETSKEKWAGPTGRIDIALLQKHLKDMKKPVYYLCGPPAMVEATKQLLTSAGVKEGKIKAERWG
jgi:ferredoxin-NADP reductase